MQRSNYSNERVWTSFGNEIQKKIFMNVLLVESTDKISESNRGGPNQWAQASIHSWQHKTFLQHWWIYILLSFWSRGYLTWVGRPRLQEYRHNVTDVFRWRSYMTAWASLDAEFFTEICWKEYLVKLGNQNREKKVIRNQRMTNITNFLLPS